MVVGAVTMAFSTVPAAQLEPRVVVACGAPSASGTWRWPRGREPFAAPLTIEKFSFKAPGTARLTMLRNEYS